MDQFRKVEKIKRDARDRILELTLSQLKLYATICRFRAFYASSARQKEYEMRAREQLGRAVACVSRLDLTPEQKERFHLAFRALTNCLPIHPPATIIPIDSFAHSETIANAS